MNDFARAAEESLDPMMSKHGWSMERGDAPLRQYGKNDLHLRLQLITGEDGQLGAFVFLWQGTVETGKPLDLAFFVDRKQRKQVFEALDLKDKSAEELVVGVAEVLESTAADFLAGNTDRFAERASMYDGALEQAKKQHERAPKLSKALLIIAVSLALLSLTMLVSIYSR